MGFRRDEFRSAVRVFGQPDFFHKVHDRRAIAEFCDGDLVVFANGSESYVNEYTFDDSRHF